MGRFNGGNDWRTIVCLWRRDNSASAGVAFRWDEHGKRSGIYDYWFCHKNYKPWCSKNNIRHETVCPVPCFCNAILLDNGCYCKFSCLIYGAVKGGDNIGRILVIESQERDVTIIDEILEKLKNHPEFELLWLKHDPVLLLPGLEIDPAHRKVYCDNQEISLTAKEYDILCLFTANKGRVLTYDQIYQKIWKEEAFGNANNAIACHVHNLREKIGRLLPEGSFVIRCVREVGYCFELNSECFTAT